MGIMSHRKTHEDFIHDAIKIHGLKYDYSQVVYISNKHKIKIICPEHGFFEQKPNTHLNPKKIHGCPKCGQTKRSEKRKLGKELFITKAKKINPYYDYSKVEYVRNKTKVLIGCPTHGYFFTSPNQLLRSKKGCCHKCGKEKTSKALSLSQEEFLARSTKVHKNKYDYSLSVYQRKKNTLKIKCPLHGFFEQNAGNHMNGKGCKKCAIEEEGRRKKAQVEIFLLKKFKQIHGNTYNYSKVVYKGASEKLEIICKNHGSFWQRSINHQRGSICPRCSKLEGIKKFKSSMAIKDEYGKTKGQIRTEKAHGTKSIVGNDGLDGYERAFLHGAGKNSLIKHYTNKVYYQGSFEKNLLDFLDKNGELKNINRGKRYYYFYQGQKKQYRSDFLYKDNLTIEVKSSWTYGKDKERRFLNYLKFKSVLDAGQRLIVIFDKKFFIEVTYDNIDKNMYEEKFKNINSLINTLQNT